MTSKYGNRRFEADGFNWDSKAEYRRYCELRMLETAGMISHLAVKPKFTLLPAFKRDGKHYRGIIYVADFRYTLAGVEVIEDVKGMKTAVYKMKKQLLLAQYPGINFVESAA